MDTQKVLSIIIIVLLAALAAEGAVLIVNENGSSHQVEDESVAVMDKQMEMLNKNGGRISFSSGGHLDITAGTQKVFYYGEFLTVENSNGSTVVYPLSNIQSIRYNS